MPEQISKSDSRNKLLLAGESAPMTLRECYERRGIPMSLKKLLGHLLNPDPEMRPKAAELLENAWITGKVTHTSYSDDGNEEKGNKGEEEQK